MQAARAGVRSMVGRPALTAVSVLTIALGIGANTAIFSLVDSLLLRPLPYPDFDRIVLPWEYSAEIHQQLGFDRMPSSAADFTDFQARQTTFEHFGSVRAERVNLTGAGEPERVGAVRVSLEFFDVLGVRPVAGRTFIPEDASHPRTVVIAESLWQRRFGSDPQLVGGTIVLNGEPARVVGVLPRSFSFPSVGDVPDVVGFSFAPVIWTLDVLTPFQKQNRGGKSWVLVGKLKSGVSIEQAERDLGIIAADIARDFPRSNSGWTVRVVSLREQLVSRVRPGLIVLLAAVGVVLLIACANVANLLLIRATTRRRELAVRGALGATRARLVGGLLAESLLLAAVAGLAGLLVGKLALTGLVLVAPPSLPALAAAAVDLRAVAFTALVSLLTGLVLGIVPALQAAQTSTVDGLRDGARGTVGSRRGRRIRNALVVLEVGLAVVLVIAMSLLLQTFLRLTRVSPGFSADRVLTLEIALAGSAYAGQAVAVFFETLVDRLSALPGVEAVGATSGLPLAGQEYLVQITRAGEPRPEPRQEMVADYRAVTPGYFAALQVPLLQGTGIPEQSGSGSTPVVVINEMMARTSWPGQDPLGRQIKLTAYEQDAPWHTVIGVVGDTRLTGLDQALRPQVYVDYRQAPSARMAIVLRASGDPMAFAAPARAAVSAIDADQPIAQVRTLRQVIDASVSARRFYVLVVVAFAVLAVTLALVGLYAVVAYSVVERRDELGIRAALGARPADLLTLVLTDGLKLVSAGIAVGVLAAFLLARFLENMLFGVHARDASTFVAVAAMLLVVSMLGCAVPAWRAMRIDPATALRSE